MGMNSFWGFPGGAPISYPHDCIIVLQTFSKPVKTRAFTYGTDRMFDVIVMLPDATLDYETIDFIDRLLRTGVLSRE